MADNALKDRITRMWKQRGQDSQLQTSAPEGATILIVDDSRTMVHALKTFLEQSGYNTLTAMDGSQAVSAARMHKPDLILMDIVMPRMNGFEATRILTKDPETGSIPIIIVSGTERETDKVWGLRIGAKGFLAKPIRKTQLMESIEGALAESRSKQASSARGHYFPNMEATARAAR
jgi:twitching motility two-component system response regulator PilH